MLGILKDYLNGRMEAHQVKRAVQLRNIMTSLGPAYIKLGQALSIRPDLLSPAAMAELQRLCDKVWLACTVPTPAIVSACFASAGLLVHAAVRMLYVAPWSLTDAASARLQYLFAQTRACTHNCGDSEHHMRT